MKDLDEQITWTLLHYGGWCCEQIEASDTDKQFHEAKAKIQELITQARLETEKAFGGCKDCYGKGYATVRSGIIGYEDFGGDGFKTPPTNKMKYCKCKRGEQLATLNGVKK